MKIETKEEYDKAFQRFDEIIKAEADRAMIPELWELCGALMDYERQHLPERRVSDDEK